MRDLMSDLKEGMFLFVVWFGVMASLAIALAITAIAEMLPWIILAGAAGVCAIIGTTTACIIKLRQSRQPQSPPPIYYIQDHGEYIQLPRSAHKELSSGKKTRTP